MSEGGFRDLKDSKGFEGGGFSDVPQPAYGPRYIAINQKDLPEPSFTQHGKGNVQYTLDKPFPNAVQVRSQHDLDMGYKPIYALPHEFIYEADKQGNIIGPLKG